MANGRAAILRLRNASRILRIMHWVSQWIASDSAPSVTQVRVDLRPNIKASQNRLPQKSPERRSGDAPSDRALLSIFPNHGRHFHATCPSPLACDCSHREAHQLRTKPLLPRWACVSSFPLPAIDAGLEENVVSISKPRVPPDYRSPPRDTPFPSSPSVRRPVTLTANRPALRKPRGGPRSQFESLRHIRVPLHRARMLPENGNDFLFFRS